MWLCVDRMEGDTVILIDDEAAVLSLPRKTYEALTGRAPRESDVLRAEVKDGQILSAACDETETARRREAANARLSRLFGKTPKA